MASITSTHVDTNLVTTNNDFHLGDTGILDIAGKYLEGYTGRYFFCALSTDKFLLLYNFANDHYYLTTDLFTCAACQAVVIVRQEQSQTRQQQQTLSGTITSAGTNTSVSNVSLAGNVNIPIYEDLYYCGLTTIQTASITIQPDSMIFSDSDYTPHLIEGVQNYEFAQIFIMVCVIIFALADRLFSRFSRNR